MDLNGKSAGVVTPVKHSKLYRSMIDEISRKSENFNPNTRSPGLNFSTSPLTKSSTKFQKSVKKKCGSVNIVASPHNKEKIQERKFVIAKKSSKREKGTIKADFNSHEGLCVANKSLRASQEEFFKNRSSGVIEDEMKLTKSDVTEIGVEAEGENNCEIRYSGKVDGFYICSDTGRLEDKHALNERQVFGEMQVSHCNNKRGRDKLFEDAREILPEPGSGRVMHLVKAFENILSLPKSKDSADSDEVGRKPLKKGIKLELPGLQPPTDNQSQVSFTSICPSDLRLTSESLGLDSLVSCSSDSSQGSISSKKSSGHRRSRHNESAESSVTSARRRRKKRQFNPTFQQPFKLRTELRGRCKEEEFVNKVQQMMEEEEKQRIPIAQGLPWTTDKPQCLVKPLVKESTRPADLVLQSEVRAVERAEFDHQVEEKMNLIEQYQAERHRQQKLAEEEEIRRLRKELVPKAQPMPYFDRPFIPKRSEKLPTIPREPKFHLLQQKKIKPCTSSSELCFTDQL